MIIYRFLMWDITYQLSDCLLGFKLLKVSNIIGYNAKLIQKSNLVGQVSTTYSDVKILSEIPTNNNEYFQMSDVSWTNNCSGNGLFEKNIIINHFLVSKNVGIYTPQTSKFQEFAPKLAIMCVVNVSLSFYLS